MKSCLVLSARNLLEMLHGENRAYCASRRLESTLQSKNPTTERKLLLRAVPKGRQQRGSSKVTTIRLCSILAEGRSYNNAEVPWHVLFFSGVPSYENSSKHVATRYTARSWSYVFSAGFVFC